MAGLLKIYIPHREAAVDQLVWVQNIDKKPIYIDWGDGSEFTASGDVNNGYVSHAYTTPGTYNIFAYYDGVWGDDQGNAIDAQTINGRKMMLIETDEITVTDAFTIREYKQYSEATLNNEFLNLSLPTTAVGVGSNEFVVADNINDVLTKLYNNTVYLHEQTTIIDPTIKNTFVGWLSGGVGNKNLWNVNFTGLSFGDPATSPSSYTDILDIKIRDFDTTRYIYMIDNNSLKIMNGLLLEPTTLIAASSVGYNSPFVSLSAIDVDDQGNIFLLDSLVVYKARFDAINNVLIPQSQIGGLGSTTDRYLFSKPTDIASNSLNGYVAVVDSQNLCIKIYNRNLIWITNITSSLFSSTNIPEKACFNQLSGRLYIVTTAKELFIYDANLQYVSNTSLLYSANSVSLLEIIANEEIKKIISDNQDNYLYAVTDSAVVKFTATGRLINKIEEPVAPAFAQLRSGCIDAYNQLFIAKKDRVFQLSDPIISISLRRDIPEIIPLSAVLMNDSGDEFVQDWVYNKSLKRLLRDLIILNGSIQRKIVISFDIDGSLRSFYVQPLETEKKATITINLNNFLNVNEFVLSDTVNRALFELCDHQQDVLNVIKPDVIFIPSTLTYPILP